MSRIETDRPDEAPARAGAHLPGTRELDLTQPDPETDDGLRRIGGDHERVTITRRLGGIETVIHLPTLSYRGVTLTAATPSEPRFRVMLLHDDDRYDVELALTADDADVIAIWRLWGRRLRLPLLVSDGQGRLEPVEAPFGPAVERRYGRSFRTRRPRFLARRKPGISADRSHAAEADDLGGALN